MAIQALAEGSAPAEPSALEPRLKILKVIFEYAYLPQLGAKAKKHTAAGLANEVPLLQQAVRLLAKQDALQVLEAASIGMLV